MPKLSDIWIAASAADETKFEYRASASVSVDGEFSVELDDRLYEVGRALLRQPTRPESPTNWENLVSIKSSYNKYRVYSKTLETVKKFCKACAEEFIRAKETTERVIIIAPQLQVNFWHDGTAISPNGAGRIEGRWWEAKSIKQDFQRGIMGFAVGVGAVVFDKVTTHRVSGDTIRYVRVDNPEHHHEQETHPAYLLNSFGMGFDPETADVKIIPYSDAAALFFYDVAVALCKTALSLDAFLADDVKLNQAIEARASNLLSFPNTP